MNCIEPPTCPAISAPLDWNIARAAIALRRVAAASAGEPGGVPRYAVVATVSTCHGLAGALRLTR